MSFILFFFFPAENFERLMQHITEILDSRCTAPGAGWVLVFEVASALSADCTGFVIGDAPGRF
jgi:hypothetical protein